MTRLASSLGKPLHIFYGPSEHRCNLGCFTETSWLSYVGCQRRRMRLLLLVDTRECHVLPSGWVSRMRACFCCSGANDTASNVDLHRGHSCKLGI